MKLFEDYYDDDDDDEDRPKKKKEKKPKPVFQVGDIVICIKTDQGNLTREASEYLQTFKRFKVIAVSDSLAIDIGYRTPEGKVFSFTPTRFQLKERAVSKKVDPYNEEDWDSDEWKKNNLKNDKFNGLEDELKKKKFDKIINFDEFNLPRNPVAVPLAKPLEPEDDVDDEDDDSDFDLFKSL
jgi:hypothetical protein